MGKSHTTLAIVIHWLFILLYVYGIFKQIDELEQLSDPSLLIFEIIFASLFLIIVLIRYFYMRQFETFQGATVSIPKIHKFFAKTVHSLMYLCLILLPITGLMIAGLYSQGYTNEEGLMLSSVLLLHGLSADLSYLLIAIHVGAAIWSRIKGEGVWSSMVPVWKCEIATKNKTIIRISRYENNLYNKMESMITSSKKY